MPVLTLHKPAAGPIIHAVFQPSSADAAVLTQRGFSVPSVKVDLLVDTGADQTILDEDLIRSWQLHYAVASARSSGRSMPIRLYELQVQLTGKHQVPCWHIDPLEVAARPGKFSSNTYRGLLGRDVLDRALFVYPGMSKECTLAY
jgi:hypothetical protein